MGAAVWGYRRGGRRGPMEAALGALATIERRVGAPLTGAGSGRRTVSVRGWEAVADDADPAALALLPRDERHLKPGGGAAVAASAAGPVETVAARTVAPPVAGPAEVPIDRLVSPSAATVVRLGKLSGGRGTIRGRAFYLDGDRPVTVKFTVGSGPAADGIAREIAVRAALAGTGHLPAPPVLAAGTWRGLGYLVEPVVAGEHAHEPERKQVLALQLVDELLRAHRRVGGTDEPLDLHPETMDRCRRLVDAHDWVGAGRAARLLAHAGRLVADDAPLPVGWCHGDLGFSNVIVGPAGTPTLIDWEHAGRLPVAVDLAKVAVMSPRPAAVVERILAAAGPADIGDRPGRRGVADQLALIVVRELSWWERRRGTAAASGRAAPYERGIRRRIALLDLLLPDPP